ncbi:MAG: hypothetical protein JO248_09915 [Acidimicrobiia bacterium]|nr:hypothetical protein [Acidimicrobiia bacterium]
MSGDKGKGKINVAVRTNIKVATNVGEPDKTTAATSDEEVEIRQGGRTNRVDDRTDKGRR